MVKKYVMENFNSMSDDVWSHVCDTQRRVQDFPGWHDTILPIF